MTGPPLFPGWIGVFICTNLESPRLPESELTVPVEAPTDGDKTPGNGNPSAAMGSASLAGVDLKERNAVGWFVSTRISAKSFDSSAASSFAECSMPAVVTRMALQPSTTC
jgi:hypothetical protein